MFQVLKTFYGALYGATIRRTQVQTQALRESCANILCGAGTLARVAFV